MFRTYGLIGLLMILLAFVVTIFDLTGNWFFNMITVTALFTTGFWLFFDALDFHLNGSSVLHKIMKKKKIFFYLVLVGVFIGLIFDFFGILISRLWDWYYIGTPTFLSLFYYARGLIFGYGIPILMYYSFYRVVLWLVKREFPHKFGIKIIKKKITNKMFRYILMIGIMALLIPLVVYPFVRVTNTFFGAWTFSLVLLGMWFILEYIQHQRKEKTLLEDILTGKWKPLLGLIISAVVTALIWEGLNVLKPSWTYKNLIFQKITLLGVPLQVILGWIPLYIIYLSFYRAVIKGKDKVWEV